MIASGTALALSAAAAGAAGAAGATALAINSASGGGGSGVQAPTPLSPSQLGGDSLSAQLALAPQILSANQRYAPEYANLYNQTQQQLLFGAPYFNANQALENYKNTEPAYYAGILSEAAATGRTPEQWLTDHVTEQAARGDANAQAVLSRFGGTSNNGALSLYQQVAPQLSQIQNQANTAQRTADIADVANLGAQATAAYRSANPELAAAINSLTGSVNSAAASPAPQVNINPASAGLLGSAAMAPVANANAASAASTGYNASLANPFVGSASSATGGPLLGMLERDAAGNLGRVSGIQNTLNQQARSLLNSNGALSPEEINRIQQDTRAAAAARGIYDSNSAIAAEAMNTEAARRKRLLENQQAALGIDSAGQQQLLAGRQYAQGVQGQGQGLSQFNTGSQNTFGLANLQAANQAALTNAAAQNAASQFGAQANNQASIFNAGNQNAVSLANADAANRAALANAQAQNQFALTQFGTNADMARYNAGLSYQQQLANAGLQMQNQQQGISNLYNLAGLQGNLAQDPFQMVLGRSGVLNQAGGVVGQASGANIGTPVFDPFNSSILNIYAGNQANQLAANTANANNRAAVTGAGLGMLGQLGGAAIAAGMFCWVAREVYGRHNPRWLVFRSWILNEAPAWLRNIYGRYGERFAAYIHDKPALKAAVRRLMDVVVDPRMVANPQPV